MMGGARGQHLSEPPSPETRDESAVRSAHPPAAADVLVGATINDKYRILDVLATGGMGRVYRAEQAPLGRIVAVKVLLPDLGGDRSVVTSASAAFNGRFLREASVLAKLQNAYVVTFFDYGRIETPPSDRERFFMAMELLEGETLQARLDQSGALSIPTAVTFLRQIALGLRAAHALGTVHRDLKPQNLMIVKGAEGEEVIKVFDFGVTKSIDDNQDATEEGVVIGSPRFMSPEQIGGGKIDARTDIYSLGIIAFTILVGKPPFSGESSIHTMMAHMNTPFPALAPLRPDVPGWLVELIERCTQKGPESRPGSIDEVLEAFRTHLAGAGLDGMSSDARLLQASGAFAHAGVAVSDPVRAIGDTGSGAQARPVSPAAPRIASFAALLAVVAGLAFFLLRPRAVPPATLATPASVAAPAAAPALHRLVVTSTPSGAGVFSNGRSIGTTPLVDSLVEGSGTTHIELRKEGYESYTRDLEPTHDIEISAVLRAIPSPPAPSAAPAVAPSRHAHAPDAKRGPRGTSSDSEPSATTTATAAAAPTPAQPKPPAKPGDPFEDRE